ncbi:MAG: hypothetical protein WBJ22_01795 [Minisyncoccales bacterium]
MRRICIKCGFAFRGTKKENICPDCKFQILKEMEKEKNIKNKKVEYERNKSTK